MTNILPKFSHARTKKPPQHSARIESCFTLLGQWERVVLNKLDYNTLREGHKSCFTLNCTALGLDV